MGKRIGILQSNYIPWKGYFDLINSVDEFVLFDDMQYTRRDWRNRNLIKTDTGVRWVTIPVQVKGRYLQKINEVKVSDAAWAREHWASIKHSYARAPHFRDYNAQFEELYLGTAAISLSEINHSFITAICRILGINTEITWSSQYRLCEGKNERLIGICAQAGGSEYLSGPAAASYLDVKKFEQAGISVGLIDYRDYPEYGQLHPPFVHGVTILDLLFNEGPAARHYCKSFSPPPGGGDTTKPSVSRATLS